MNNEEKNIEQGTAPESNNTSWWAKLTAGVKAGIIAAAALVVIIPIVLVIALGGNSQSGNEGGSSDNGGETNGKVTYTVTVKNEDGQAIKGAKVTFTTSGGTEMPWTTDANGVATYKSADTVKVKVTEIPAGYTYSKLGAVQSFDANGNLEVIIAKIDLPDWTIRVVDQDGNGIAGVNVQMCAEFCLQPITTDADGYAVYKDKEGDYKAQLSYSELKDLPEGYTVDLPLDEYYYFVDGVATITLTKI